MQIFAISAKNAESHPGLGKWKFSIQLINEDSVFSRLIKIEDSVDYLTDIM